MTKVLVLDNATGQIKEEDIAVSAVNLYMPAHTQAPLLLRISLVSNAYVLAYVQAGTSLQIGVIT